MDHLDETRKGSSGTSGSNREVSDATQRVWVDSEGRPTSAPVRRSSSGQTSQRRNTSASGKTPPRRSSDQRKKQERIMIIALCAIAAVLLIAVIAVVVTMLLPSSSDDDRIAGNVYAAGVNLSGMDREQAAKALHEATDNTYSRLNMTVQVLDTEIILSPELTGAKLDVDKVIDAALEYNSSNKSQNSTYSISIVDCLNLDTSYIKRVLSELGEKYSTTLKQTTYSVTGTRPSMDLEDKDTSIVYETLTINIGTAEYGLNTNTLYEQIMDAYNINLFQVTGECSVVAPDALDYEALYESLCVAPVNAEFDANTYEVTPEEYGYGFKLEDLKSTVESAAFGSTVVMELRFIEPDITAKFYTDEMFQDKLASFQTKLSGTADWNTNLMLACQAINGTIIKSGEEFSFNNIVGETTSKKGYKSVGIYVGRSFQEITGGGICQVSSTLYSCALLADLEILERTSHSYAPTFIDAGLDAEVYYGSADLRFKNTTEQPIRIDAVVEDGYLKITLVGTDSKDYTVEITYEITKTKEPETVYSTLLANNPGGYKDGDVLSEGILGCNVSVYKCTYAKETKNELSKDLISETYYAKRDTVVVKIQAEDIPVDPTDPTDPTDSTGPSNSEPTDSSNPTESIPEETAEDNS